jgi:hypothetical protein
VHGGTGQPQLAGQGANAPTALEFGLLAHPVLNLFPHGGTVRGRPTGTGSILQPIQSETSEAPSPLARGDLGNAQCPGDLLVRLLVGGGKDNSASNRETLWRRRGFHELLQTGPLPMVQPDERGDSEHAQLTQF